MTPPNIPEQIASSPSTPLTLNPDVTAEKVKQFIAEAQAHQTVEEKPKPVALESEADFDIKTAEDAYLTEALVNVSEKEIEITEEEKVIFFKALVNEECVCLPVNLFNNNFRVDLRSRYTYEQGRIYDVLRLDNKQNILTGDTAQFFTRLQYYCAALMVQRVNGVLFSELELKTGSKLEDDAKKLRDFVETKIETMPGIRWTAIINSMRVFETKCARMNSEAANGDFWKPRG